MSTVIAALGADVAERWPAPSCAIPAATCTFKVPLPLQLLSAILAPEVVMLLTATLHDGLPELVVTVTPPPLAVSVPVSVVAPLFEGVRVSARVVEPVTLSKVADGTPKLTTGPNVSIVYVFVTVLPVPTFPTTSVIRVGSIDTVKACASVHVPPTSVIVATVWALFSATDPTVGVIVHDPARVMLPAAGVFTALLNVATTCVGALPRVDVAGVKLTKVGAVLSTVMVALCADAAEALLALSCAMPPAACTVRVPLPLQLLSVMVAPDVVILLTDTLHDTLPETVVTFTPPPLAVRLPVSEVGPAAEGVSVNARVVEPATLSKVADGAPKLATGPVVSIVYVLVTTLPVPARPLTLVTCVGSIATVNVWPLVHLPPTSAMVATVCVLSRVTAPTVGAVLHVPPTAMLADVGVFTVSLNVATTCVGAVDKVAVEGVKLTNVGGVPPPVVGVTQILPVESQTSGAQ